MSDPLRPPLGYIVGGLLGSLPHGYAVLIPRGGSGYKAFGVAVAGEPLERPDPRRSLDGFAADADLVMVDQLAVGYEVSDQGDVRLVSTAKADETIMTDAEWEEAKTLALRQVAADRLTRADEHLALIRTLIQTAVARDVV